MKTLGLIICLTLFSGSIYAEEMFMLRTVQTFPEAMSSLQAEIKEHGYTISRVQRVDIGLTKSGYQTDKYRVVFFGKVDEIKWISEHHPQWIPYLPLKIAIFSEGQDTLLIASDPAIIIVSDDKELSRLLSQWQKDIRSMLNKIAQTESD